MDSKCPTYIIPQFFLCKFELRENSQTAGTEYFKPASIIIVAKVSFDYDRLRTFFFN